MSNMRKLKRSVFGTYSKKKKARIINRAMQLGFLDDAKEILNESTLEDAEFAKTEQKPILSS
jgi:hypothetical protein